MKLKTIGLLLSAALAVKNAFKKKVPSISIPPISSQPSPWSPTAFGSICNTGRQSFPPPPTFRPNGLLKLPLGPYGYALEAAKLWNMHSATRIAAALAYYGLLSMAPLTLLIVLIISQFFGDADARTYMLAQVQNLAGSTGAATFHAILENQKENSSGMLASLVTFATLLFGASGVMMELREALNTIWSITPRHTNSFLRFFMQRLLSFAMLLAVGILLLASLAVSTALSYFNSWMGDTIPWPPFLSQSINNILFFVVITLLFALIFRYVPDARLPWKPIFLGAMFTTVLFLFGKSLIATYLGSASVGSAFGAAGSIVAMVVWVYYSSLIFLYGAEITRLCAQSQAGRAGVHEPVPTV